MTLRNDLIQLANDYGIPGVDVAEINATPAQVEFTYFRRTPDGHRIVAGHEFATTTETFGLDASPVRDEGTPIYDALKAERP